MISIFNKLLMCPKDRKVTLEYFEENMEAFSHLRDFMLEDGTIVYGLYTFINRSKLCIWPAILHPYTEDNLAFAWDCSRQIKTIQKNWRNITSKLTTRKIISAITQLNQILPHEIVLKIIQLLPSDHASARLRFS